MATRLSFCTKCGKAYHITDFMNPDSSTVFKWCISCRKRGRARGHLRRERKQVIIQALNAQDQAQPQLNQLVLSGLALSGGSAFSRRNPIFTFTNPIPAATSSEGTPSTTLETEETESSVTQPESSQASESDNGSPTPLELEEGESHEPHAPSSTTTSLYFMCIHCGIPRKASREAPLDSSGFCIYCLQDEQKFCIRGQHEADRGDFIDEKGEEQISCKDCRETDSFDDSVMVKGERSDDE